MSNQSNAAIKTAADILIQAKQDVLEQLSSPDHSNIAIAATTQLDQLINRFHFLSGTDHQAATVEVFPPVTNFMGEDIALPKQIQKEDLEPGEADRLIFVDKVERLYAEFLTIPNEGILNSYTLPEDQLVVRGVAKKAGIEGYADREFTTQFLEEIAEGIKSKEAEDAKQKEIDLKLLQLDKQSGTDPEKVKEEGEDQDDEDLDDELDLEEKSTVGLSEKVKEAEDAKQTKKSGKR